MFFPKLISLINNPIKDVPFKNYVNEVCNEVQAKKKRTISQLGHPFFPLGHLGLPLASGCS